MAIQINGTSGISGVDGSAGTPALQGTDSNTGISFGTDTVNINTGGTTRATVSSTGRLGVGTASPSVELHVSNSEIARVAIGSSYPMTLYTDSSGAGENPGIFWINSKALRFSTSPTGISTTGQSEKARIDSSGRLLVGTSTAPTGSQSQYSKFAVIGNTAGATGSYITLGHGGSASSFSTGTDLGSIYFTDNAAGEFANIRGYSDGGSGPGDYPGRLSFATTPDGSATPVERMRIQSSGRKTLFSSDTSHCSSVLSNQGAGTSTTLYLGAHTSSGYGTGTISFQVFTNGNVQNTNNSYTGISDIKLKENIVDATSQWDDIKALRPVNYNFKPETGQQTHTQLGLIAQEVELVSPGLVTESPDRDEEGNDLGTVTKSVNYSVLYMKAVKALQEAMERIETLETRVAQLEGGAS